MDDSESAIGKGYKILKQTLEPCTSIIYWDVSFLIKNIYEIYGKYETFLDGRRKYIFSTSNSSAYGEGNGRGHQ